MAMENNYKKSFIKYRKPLYLEGHLRELKVGFLDEHQR
jgi:hypothetical protein